MSGFIIRIGVEEGVNRGFYWGFGVGGLGESFLVRGVMVCFELDIFEEDFVFSRFLVGLFRLEFGVS